MTAEQIEKAGAIEAIKYATATKIRTLLDEAREAYGADAWDENDVEAAVLELVTTEDES